MNRPTPQQSQIYEISVWVHMEILNDSDMWKSASVHTLYIQSEMHDSLYTPQSTKSKEFTIQYFGMAFSQTASLLGNSCNFFLLNTYLCLHHSQVTLKKLNKPK